MNTWKQVYMCSKKASWQAELGLASMLKGRTDDLLKNPILLRFAFASGADLHNVGSGI